MNQLRTDNVYTPMIREKVNKKVQFGAAMSVAKTSIQIAVTENVTAELIGILTQFIMKYRRSTGLSIENTESAISFSGTRHHISMVYASKILRILFLFQLPNHYRSHKGLLFKIIINLCPFFLKYQTPNIINRKDDLQRGINQW